MLRGILSSLKRFFLRRIWPIVRTAILEFVREIMEWLFRRIFDWVQDYFKKTRENYKKTGEDAENEILNSKNKTELEKSKAIAQIWREVAENLLRDKEELEDNLKNFMKDQESVILRRVEELNPEEVFSFKGKKIELFESVKLGLPEPEKLKE